MAAVVVDVVGELLAVFFASDSAADAGFAFVVFSEVLRVRKDGLQELERNNFDAIVVNFVNTCHTDILNYSQVGEVFLAECHPEARALYGREVFNQTLQFLVVHQVAFARSDVRIGERLVDFQRTSLNPFAVLPEAAFLGDFPDVDFRVEVCGESLVVVAGVAVDNVEVLNFVEMVFGGISRVNTTDTRVETAA